MLQTDKTMTEKTFISAGPSFLLSCYKPVVHSLVLQQTHLIAFHSSNHLERKELYWGILNCEIKFHMGTVLIKVPTVSFLSSA